MADEDAWADEADAALAEDCADAAELSAATAADAAADESAAVVSFFLHAPSASSAAALKARVMVTDFFIELLLQGFPESGSPAHASVNTAVVARAHR